MPRARAVAAGLAVAAVLAGSATAEPLTMRSGEHRGFTRLTLPVPPEGGWQLGRVEGGYGLRLSGATSGIDLSTVFTRIRRDRLAEIRVTEAGVDLVLGCNCHAVAFEERGLIVVDLRDGPPPEGARFEGRLEEAVRRAQPIPRRAFDWTRDFVAAPQPAAAGPVEPPEVPPAPVFGSEPARDLIARQFSRAVAQGLIGADVSRSETVAAHLRQIAPQQNVLDNLRIGATTGVDRARDGTGQPPVDREGDACPPDAQFDLAAWGSEAALAPQIAERRRALLGEFDLPDPDSVLDLARLYLHAGFGAEARALLETLPPSEAEGEALGGIAALIDEGAPKEGEAAAFAAHVGCGGAVALWAVLGAPDLAGVGVIDRMAVRRAFAALPTHLRAHLGPRLAQRFLDISDTDTALALRNAMGPAQDRPNSVAVLDAGLELAQGRPAAASEIAQAAADGGGPDSAEALATMVEARLDGGLPLSGDTVEDLVAVAREHAGTPLGLRLARLEGVALAERRLWDAAFAVRDRLRADATSAPVAAALSRDLLGRMVQDAPDPALMARVFAETGWQEGGLTGPDRLRLAERLLEAGFAQEALSALPPEPFLPEEVTLAARALLAIDAPARALRILAGHRGAEALRGDALLAMGEHRGAFAVFTEAGLEAEAQRAAWLGGFWEDAAGGSEDAVAALIGRSISPTPDTAEDLDTSTAEASPEVAVSGFPGGAAGEGELAQAAAILAEGAELRRMVAEMLSAYPPPSE